MESQKHSPIIISPVAEFVTHKGQFVKNACIEGVPDNVEELYSTFSACPKLENINFGSNTFPNLTTMYYAFSACSSLESLDLSNFNTSKLTSMTSTFRNCSALNTYMLVKGASGVPLPW